MGIWGYGRKVRNIHAIEHVRPHPQLVTGFGNRIILSNSFTTMILKVLSLHHQEEEDTSTTTNATTATTTTATTTSNSDTLTLLQEHAVLKEKEKISYNECSL